MKPTKVLFEVYDGKKGEREHSRRYKAKTEGSPISDIYIKRPYADKKDRVYVTIEPKGD